ncbi:hypothetical protein BC833DRAFT_626644 [Globomyces pollinis-pini]|nr:hypothetical protein BC833DRAFT_626644 [Globomyces pollinis-pini]
MSTIIYYVYLSVVLLATILYPVFWPQIPNHSSRSHYLEDYKKAAMVIHSL